MTGEPAVDTAIKALELGAIHYLTKPLDVLSLDEIVARGVRMGRIAKS
jgi:DNA-binding NtrC family response regulator